jgi:hypothetical protein
MAQETASPNEEVSDVLAFAEASPDQDSLQTLAMSLRCHDMGDYR